MTAALIAEQWLALFIVIFAIGFLIGDLLRSWRRGR